MASISKTWKSAGSKPGQYQKLTITFLSREGSNVKVKFTLYAKSLGYDYYHYKTRHNKATVSTTGGSGSRTYQLYGNHAKKTLTKTFTVTGVPDETTSLDFYYRNARVWATKTNSWDPRSTGVVSKTKVGSLSVPKNAPCVITFDGVITEDIETYECFYSKYFQIPDIKFDDHCFEFKGWTTEDYAAPYRIDDQTDDDETDEESDDNSTVENDSTIWKYDWSKKAWVPVEENIVNENSEDDNSEYDIPLEVIRSVQVDYSICAGREIQVLSDINYYAVWRPKTCRYAFYDNDKLLFTLDHEWGSSTELPNPDTYDNKKYYIPGYECIGWKCDAVPDDTFTLGTYCTVWPPESSSDYVVKFYLQREPITNTVDFILYPNTVRSYEYLTNSEFNIDKPPYDIGKNPITLKPGYKLIGWSTITPKVIAQYTDSLSSDGVAMPGQGFNLPGLRQTKYIFKDSYDGIDNVSPKTHYSGQAGGMTFRIYPVTNNLLSYSDTIFNYSDFKDNNLKLYPYYEYYTTLYVYYNGEWRLAMPYIYKDNEWKMALSYVYSDDTWRL